MPCHVGFCDVAGTIRIYYIKISRLSVYDVDQALGMKGDGRTSAVKGFAKPEFLALGGVVTLCAEFTVEDELRWALCFNEYGCTPTSAWFVFTFCFPDYVPRCLVEGD
jgi:hypothetical protein